jgi:sRNA-binding carbon storage regulator CsrA
VSDSSILEVLNPQTGSIIFPIKLIDTGALWERETHDVHVTLICQKTGQEVKLPPLAPKHILRREQFNEIQMKFEKFTDNNYSRRVQNANNTGRSHDRLHHTELAYQNIQVSVQSI